MAKEKQLRCDRGEPKRRAACPTVRSDELARLVPAGQEFGYDLIVFVGRARYLQGRQRLEIQAALAEQGVQISTGTISTLCDRFLLHLERLHLKRSPALAEALASGYALHLDATCDKGKGGHLVCLDGITGWVLQAARIDSESEEALAPVVRRTVKLFGTPVATMRDLGKGGERAIQPLRELGVIDLICHLHFLRAVGIKLFAQAYDRLRTLLKGLALRSELLALRKKLKPYQDEVGSQGDFGPGRVREPLRALVHWLIEGEGVANPNFPFALPHLELVLRCQGMTEVASKWLPRPWGPAESRVMRRLEALRNKVAREPRIAATVAELQQGWRVFEELRAVLRLGADDSQGGSGARRQLPVPSAEALRLHQIEMAVRQYEEGLRTVVGPLAKRKRGREPEGVVLGYLEKYRDQLFGHPAIRDEQGRIVAVVERTNNALEHFFGAEKQGLRRRLGRANLGRDLQQQPAQAMLARNLRDARYVQILCGSLENLPAAFADLRHAEVENGVLTRDHRDSPMDRAVRRLTRHTPPPACTGLAPPLRARTNARATAI
ncbi:hypothetical protein H8E07_06245 [bacterium]|nr:hypothetical protein [bacterium]